MWDSNSPLQLLNNMPKRLTKENLEKLQLVIDADKYKNSIVSGFDLCGMYAPFCIGCKKTSIYPCALAYINMMKASGRDIEIDAKPIEGGEQFTAPVQEAPVVNAVEAEEEVAVAEETVALEEPEITYESYEPIQVIEQEVEEETPEAVEEPQPPASVPVKRKIRIAVARKKI